MHGGISDSIQEMSARLSALLSELPAIDDNELIDSQRELQVVARKVYAAQLELDAATERAGLTRQHGYASVGGLLMDVLRLPRAEARTRDTHRDAVATRRSLAGEILPPRLPHTAAALAAGAIGAAHVEVIDTTLRALPDTVDLGTREVVEKEIATFARAYSPRETGVLAAQLLSRLDPDGQAPRDPDDPPDPDNTLRLGRSRTGRLRIVGEFTADAEAAIRAMLDALAKPSPPIEGIPDERSTAQRHGDALVEAAHQVLGFGDLPEWGQRPHLTVTVDLEDLQRKLRMALLDYGPTLHPETARMLACDAAVVPIVLKTPSQPLDVGRSTRVLNAALRRALITRAGGCCEMPGCGRPATACDGHHIRHWADGGPTALGNLVLLCKRHHRLVHRPGWHISIRTDGHPVFIPPGLIDPTRTPRPSRMDC